MTGLFRWGRRGCTADVRQMIASASLLVFVVAICIAMWWGIGLFVSVLLSELRGLL